MGEIGFVDVSKGPEDLDIVLSNGAVIRGNLFYESQVRDLIPEIEQAMNQAYLDSLPHCGEELATLKGKEVLWEFQDRLENLQFRVLNL